MMDLQAALGIHQLARIESNLQVRETQWQRYQTELADLPLDLPPDVPNHLKHARHLYTVLVQPDAPLDRDSLMLALHERGIGSGVHYRPVHEHTYYRDRLGYRKEDFPVASDIGSRTLSLPLGPAFSEDDLTRVIEGMQRFLA